MSAGSQVQRETQGTATTALVLQLGLLDQEEGMMREYPILTPNDVYFLGKLVGILRHVKSVITYLAASSQRPQTQL